MEKLDKTISEIWESDYIIPLYQRNYAWGETQITRLLQDIHEAMRKKQTSNYYIGSLVVLERPDGLFEVIDGQQRLTTLHLLCKTLESLQKPHLSYESRPEVEDFFTQLFRKSTDDFLNDCDRIATRKTYRLAEAMKLMQDISVYPSKEDGENKGHTIREMSQEERDAFAKYINENVILIRTILPADTDVAAYFEIMNNRGEQLQEHEIVKALLIRNLKSDKISRDVFSTIWDACSQMEIPIQKSLSDLRLDKDHPLFDEGFGGLIVENIKEYSSKEKEMLSSPLTIDEILQETDMSSVTDLEDNDEEIKYEPIIDFPNFLMHMLRMEMRNKLAEENSAEENKVPLNANDLLSEYEKLKEYIKPEEFIMALLKYRTLFDRYIIKCQGEGEEDENLKWVMLKPYLYHNNNKDEDSLKYKNTFSRNESRKDADENETAENVQKRITMQESMLQVTFRNRKYKNWLFDLLVWLGEHQVIESVCPEEMIAFLDKWMTEYYNEIAGKEEDPESPFESKGTQTPHFVLNFIDYLYWVAKTDGIQCNGVDFIDKVDDFNFRYYNSVEHHLPQSYTELHNEENIEEGKDITPDNIGNLCLISRRKNSSLNDKAPTEKAKLEVGLQPKRKIMYHMTIENKLWDLDTITEHYNSVMNLLNLKKEILKLS